MAITPHAVHSGRAPDASSTGGKDHGGSMEKDAEDDGEPIDPELLKAKDPGDEKDRIDGASQHAQMLLSSLFCAAHLPVLAATFCMRTQRLLTTDGRTLKLWNGTSCVKTVPLVATSHGTMIRWLHASSAEETFMAVYASTE
eukprot:1649742-Pleurochrysis_carterae.AAC.1